MPEAWDLLEHHTLKCALRGDPSKSTIQFRGLKYASVPARYKPSVPHDTLGTGIDSSFDATHFGPSCPQKRGAQAWDFTLIGNVDLPCASGQGDTEKMDEFECLHVNVTVPTSTLEAANRETKDRLPVFVWVHGGGLSMGSNSWPQYDVRGFVKRSVEIGKPIVAVAINYRHGIFGFLASEEIGAEGNMGFKDQVLAFRWIKKHIAGFGGDPDNVTAAGESAGGISLSTLLCADIGNNGLFERVILMSGDTTLRKPRNQQWQQRMYEDQFEYLKEDQRSLKSTLLEVEAGELAQRLPLAQHFTGTIDGLWLKGDVTLNTLMDRNRIEHKPAWCEEFVVGDAAHDGTVLKVRILDQPQALARLKTACDLYLSPSEAHQLLTAYGLSNTPVPSEVTGRLREIASELRFYLPCLAAYRGWKSSSTSKRASRYHFHVPNPIQGFSKGLASHELDVVYLLQNFNAFLDEKNCRIAREMADQFLKFTNGEGWSEDSKIIAFGCDGLIEVEEQEYDPLYRSGRGKVLEAIGAAKLWHVAEAWQGVRKEEFTTKNNL